jgi:hypothetical protein
MEAQGDIEFSCQESDIPRAQEEDTLMVHLHWYDEFQSKFEELGSLAGSNKVIKQRERLLALVEVKNVCTVSSVANLSVNVYADASTLTDKEQRRLEEYLKIIS